MGEYELNSTVVACDVDLKLLQSIDQYLTGEIEGSTTLVLSGNCHRPARTRSSGATGRKRQPKNRTFNSVAEYDQPLIADGTTSIVMERRETGSSNRVRLSLSSSAEKGKNQLLISPAGPGDASRVHSMAQPIHALLNEKRAITRFVHSAWVYPLFLLCTVLPIGYLARDIIGKFTILDASYSVVAATVYSFIFVFVIRQFVPYCVFDSQANRQAKVIAACVTGTLVAIFVMVVV